MYQYIKGLLVDLTSEAVVVETAGLAYYIYFPNPYRLSDQKGQQVQVWLYQAVSQDAIRLYGFFDQAEKQLFLQLISVSGIGPKSALSILAYGDQAGFIAAIESENVKFLTKFPGVGKKTAQQIILDLQSKLTRLKSEALPADQEIISDQSESSQMMIELEAALNSLGYAKREIDQVIKKGDFSEVDNTADAIRVALRYITLK
ncbi:Holliday junction branch migration protein RuvA [Aerococcus tenax]|uniref:Holliday junction branch migration protein RuvA n=1 Tax=Aerococcus tenax TaxID=3078812 RepID=UPI001E5E792D|nr:Holliday junction branch migration protein RuvA [Aerococcus tenax]